MDVSERTEGLNSVKSKLTLEVRVFDRSVLLDFVALEVKVGRDAQHSLKAECLAIFLFLAFGVEIELLHLKKALLA